MQLFYSDDYAATSHEIDATQKPAWIAASLKQAPIPGVTLVTPEPASDDDLLSVHSPAYVDAVRTGRPRRRASSSSYPWNEGTWTSAVASSGGMLAACRTAMREGISGSLSAGFHHAGAERGQMHCIFNGLAMAVAQLHKSGVEYILHIDLDAHCGGGTFSLVGELPGYHQLDVSLFSTDKYVPTGPSTLDVVDSAERYLATLGDRLDELSSELPHFNLCLFYAGMDPHEGSAFGGLPGIDATLLEERDELIFSTMHRHGVPVAFALGGGYIGPGLDQEGLVGLHRQTVALAAGQCPE